MANDVSNPAGLLGALLGQPSEAQQAGLAKAMASANDLTTLVKKKKKPANGTSTTTPLPDAGSSKGKRKLEAGEDSRSERTKRTMADREA